MRVRVVVIVIFNFDTNTTSCNQEPTATNMDDTVSMISTVSPSIIDSQPLSQSSVGKPEVDEHLEKIRALHLTLQTSVRH